jgi:Ca2+-binding RTX toxin-like protein
MEWATMAGTATAGSEYVAASGTVTIKADTTNTPVHITIKGDDETSEISENFFVQLTAATNATPGATNSAGTATILNNDFSGKLINSSTSKTAVNLIGAIHNAALISGDGNDTITGSSGDDLLRQGTGVDQLSGGAGNEVLEYTSISQSTRSTTTANTTQDYILNWNLSTSPSTGDRIKLPSQPNNLFNAGLIKASPISVLPSARALRTRTEPKPATVHGQRRCRALLPQMNSVNGLD